MDDEDKKQLGRISLRQRVVKSGPNFGPGVELKKLSERFGVPAVDLRQVCIRLDDLDLLPREVARRHVILPLLVREDRLFIAMANPADKKVIDELEFVADKKVYPYVTMSDALTGAIEEVYKAKAAGEAFYVGPECPPEVVEKAKALRPQSEPPPPSVPGQSEPRDSLPPGDPSIFLDDASDRMREAEVEDDGFGDTSRDLSVVTEIPEPSSVDPGAKTVLIVDDEEDIRNMLHRLFKSKGYNVLVANEGKTALRAVKERTPDVIILDAMLPEVHGFEIARRIKASERYRHIPIIMVSAVYRGWRFAEDLKETCGVEHYLEKPFKIADIVAAVEQALTAERAGKADEQITADAESELEAGVLAYQEGRIDDAVAHLRRGVAIDPLAYRLHFHLGLLFGKKGMVYDAIGELERAVEINARHFPALKNLAILYQKAGFRNKAAETWQRALNAAPDDATRESIKQHLMSLL